MSQMDRVIAMCNEGIQYPQNLPPTEHLDHVLSSYFQQLNKHHQLLFCREGGSRLTFRTLDHNGKGSCDTIVLLEPALTLHITLAFWSIPVNSLEDLRYHLGIQPRAERLDPRCRFL